MCGHLSTFVCAFFLFFFLSFFSLFSLLRKIKFPLGRSVARSVGQGFRLVFVCGTIYLLPISPRLMWGSRLRRSTRVLVLC
ncbi:hypothetical protein B9Z19DRAFT_1095522 [Tuber borchii]|uniref:Uncharacterized protein n=1 Tax=Tuber borchii TaxID=42251 RepID=A0A2T6ZCM3_TUBBO|nr:hypothetical protein B9Z19DRAFT_1095522 [Tuber borchii]